MRYVICVCVRSWRNISFACFLNQGLGFRKLTTKEWIWRMGWRRMGGWVVVEIYLGFPQANSGVLI